ISQTPMRSTIVPYTPHLRSGANHTQPRAGSASAKLHGGGRQRSRELGGPGQRLVDGGRAGPTLGDGPDDEALASAHVSSDVDAGDRKSTRLNSSHVKISYTV